MALFPVRYNIVYQNRVKIYQGVDNILTLDVKNSDQKRIDISDMALKMSITDVNGREITTSDVDVSGTIKGLGTVNIPADALSLLDPQFLNFTIYRENEDTSKTIMYADTQFGAIGKMELLGSAVPVEIPPRYIETFYKHTNFDASPHIVWWYSEAIPAFEPNFIGNAEDQAMELEFKFNNTKATVTVQFTDDAVVSGDTTWDDIISFGVFPGDDNVVKTIPYPLYKRTTKWIRMKLIQDNYNGFGATFDIAKVNGNEYTIKIRDKGLGYKTGETYIIDGRLVGGPVDDSPNGAWSIYIDYADSNGLIIAYTPLAESPVAEADTVHYTAVPLNTKKSARAIDKVTIRLL